jgi:hypothetical protein
LASGDAWVGTAWRRVFLLEVPICLATALFWLVCPDSALTSVHVLAHVDPVHVSLLAQIAIVVLAIFVWFYGRWLSSGRVELRPFRYLQEGMVLSDALLSWVAIAGLASGTMQTAPALAQITMASLWLIVRVAFLIRTAPRRGAQA